MIGIRVTIQWIRLTAEGRGALRLRDNQVWEGALWCHSCGRLGYDHANIDSVLEAERLGVAAARRVVACSSCGALRCDACADQTGTMCKRCA